MTPDVAVVTPPAPMSLRDHIAAEEPPAAGAQPHVPAVAVPPVIETDPEVDADPELAKEIDALEPPKAEETPAEKAARTRKNKEAARKGMVSRLANQRDKERERATTLEREVLDLRRRLEPAPAAAQPATPQAATPARPVYDGSDPNDPEPTLETFGDKPDPFVAWTAARADWAARRVFRQGQHASRQASAQADVQRRRVEGLTSFDQHAAEVRKTVPDFDAQIADLLITGPMASVLFTSGELGPHIALELAKNPAKARELAELSQSSPTHVLVEMGAIKATVQARRTAAAAAPEPVTQAPPVPSATAGGAAAATPIDTTKTGTSARTHYEVEEAEIEDRRKRGHRY